MKRKKIVEAKVEPKQELKKRGRKPKDYVWESKFFKEINVQDIKDKIKGILDSIDSIKNVEKVLYDTEKLKFLLSGTVLQDLAVKKLETLIYPIYAERLVIKKSNLKNIEYLSTEYIEAHKEIVEALNKNKAVIFSDTIIIYTKTICTRGFLFDNEYKKHTMLQYSLPNTDILNNIDLDNDNQYYHKSMFKKKIVKFKISLEDVNTKLLEGLLNLHHYTAINLSIALKPNGLRDYVFEIGNVILIGIDNINDYFANYNKLSIINGWKNYIKEIDEEVFDLCTKNIPDNSYDYSEFMKKLYHRLTSNSESSIYYSLTVTDSELNIYGIEKELIFYNVIRYANIEIFVPIYSMLVNNLEKAHRGKRDHDVFITEIVKKYKDNVWGNPFNNFFGLGMREPGFMDLDDDDDYDEDDF